MVVRTYPIRVAGNSGPLPNETDWETVTKDSKSPVPLTEQTTVTKRTRRVGRFDMKQVVEAVKLNQPTQIALTFIDYIHHANYGVTNFELLTNEAKTFIYELAQTTGIPVTLIKTGPEFEHILDRRGLYL